MWSFGILLEELALGRAPMANLSLTSVIMSTLARRPPAAPPRPPAPGQPAPGWPAPCASRVVDAQLIAALWERRAWGHGRESLAFGGAYAGSQCQGKRGTCPCVVDEMARPPGALRHGATPSVSAECSTN